MCLIASVESISLNTSGKKHIKIMHVLTSAFAFNSPLKALTPHAVEINGATLRFYNGQKTERTALQVSLVAPLEDWCAVSVFHARIALCSKTC